MTPIVVVDPGATMSTRDVFDGLVGGLRAAGAPVVPYGLAGRLVSEGRRLQAEWKRAKRRDASIEAPTGADVVYGASAGVLERALRFDARWVLVVAGNYFHPDALIMLRRAGRRVAFVATESPYDLEHEIARAAWCDVVLTNERAAVPAFERVCPIVRYLPAGWVPGVHDAALGVGAGELSAPQHDVVFVGSGFAERIALLEAIDWTGIDLGLYGVWGALGRRSRLRRCVRAGVTPNAEASALYRRARVALNLFREAPGAESLNPRMYELAAAGCCVVSEWRAEVGEKFGESVKVFRTADEASDEIRAALEDAAWRTWAADRVRAAVAADTWETRARVVLAALAEADAVPRAA